MCDGKNFFLLRILYSEIYMWISDIVSSKGIWFVFLV